MTTNIIKMDYAEVRRQLALLFEADVTTIIKSDPGQGKTSMIREYAEEQGPDYGMFEINGALSNQPDFAGWFYMAEETYTDYDGEEVTIKPGRYSYPNFLFDKRSGRPSIQFRRGVIVFEEYGQTDVDLKRAMGQTSLEKRIGQFQAPPGFNVVMLSNYEGGRDAVTRDFDFMINRRAELHLQLDFDNWVIWAHRKGLMNITMAFAAMPANEVFSGKTPKDQGPWLTPRSLELLDRYMQRVQSHKIPFDDPGVLTTAGGIVGQGSARQYVAFANLRDRIPSVTQIIADPDGCPVPTETDQQMFVVFNMAEKADAKNVGKLVRYMTRLPGDMAVAFYRNALTKNKSLMSCSEFGDWATANKQLLAVVSSRF